MFDTITRKRDQDYYDNLLSDYENYDGKLMKVDIKETNTYYVLDVEIPGVQKEDIRLITNDDILTINVKKEESINSSNEKYVRQERKFGSMSRSFTIRDIDQDSINAKYENGVLYITLPKVSEEQLNHVKTINIE